MNASLLDPKGLWLLGLLAPLVVLYILKIRRKRLRVGSTWLWSAAQRDLLAKAPFRKLIAQLSLVLQALALILLALALSRPAMQGTEVEGGHLAIVIDVSASMAAVADPGAPAPQPTRLDRAREVAKELARALPPGSDAMVVEAGRDARITTPLDRDVRRIERALDGLAAQEVEGDLGSAVALAVDRLKGLEGGRIVVVTDGYLARPAGLDTASLPVEVLQVGAEVDNAGIVRTDVRSGIDPVTKREQVQAFLLVANTGKSPREIFVTMRQENASDVLASRRLLLPPGERVPVVLSFFPAPGDYRTGLVFDVSPKDALPVDDVAYGRVPAGDALPVVLAGPSADAPASPWIERALVSDPNVAVRKLGVAELLASTGLDPGTLVVIDGACPTAVPGGDLLILDPPDGDCLGAKVGGKLDKPVVTSWEAGDPRMRFLSFDGVGILEAKRLDLESQNMALVRATDGALVADLSTASRQITLVGFDVGQSDWPLKASFVLFIRNVIEQARAHRMAGVIGAGTTGEPLRVNVPGGAEDVKVEAPGGLPVEASLRGGLLVIPTVTRAGLYRVSWGGPGAGTFAIPVNLTSDRESDLSQRAELSASPNVVTHAPGEVPERYQDYAWVAALIALALVLLEVWHHTRKPRPTPVGAPTTPRLPERRASA